ncbi:MAG: hypothetical protein M1828_001460 [Chrysothrix sp. TS-e1954]|nr:MAG: hypothetical protein M1828_001460 [Chrysothrix sp. TS-e1954]
MSIHERPSAFHRYSRDGFTPLNREETPSRDATIDIPLQKVPTTGGTTLNGTSTPNEKGGFFHRAGPNGASSTPNTQNRRGIRRSRYGGGRPGSQEKNVNTMGRVYHKIANFSIVTRYLLYVVPVGAVLAIPIILGATVEDGEQVDGVAIQWIFAWALCAWVGLWVSKIAAHWLPHIFEFICGVVSSGVRKYAQVIAALEIPLSLAGWALVSLATFKPMMTRNPQAQELQRKDKNWEPPHWVYVMQQILAAALISSLLFLGERVLIQLISINYHRKQFNSRIHASKHNIHLLTILYDASRAMFPQYCQEFAEEDSIITDTINLTLSGKNGRLGPSGSITPMRLIQNVGRFGDKVTSAFGNVAHEVTGKNVFNPDSAHSVVIEALEKTRSAEALARRIWLSFVVEGHEALYKEDVLEVLGPERLNEAEESFDILDRDMNGDISLDEMVLTIAEFGRERHSIASSMHDVDQAIKVLDLLLCTVVFVVVCFIFVAFLNHSFVTTLATTGTALLSLSFVFSATCQEVLGSCVFLFSKHPFDIGDRVEITNQQMIVQHISLLFTVFKKVATNQVVQIPNIVLNTLWIENVTRSKAMQEQLTINVDYGTSFEDVQALKTEMVKFVTSKENNRDFYPEIDIQVMDVSGLDKMQLMLQVLHKSNWSNETIRAARRSKLMCALVLALRRVPINGAGGGGPGLGDAANPSYSVAISDTIAAQNKAKQAESVAAARLIPTKTAEATTSTSKNATSPIEQSAVGMLNERNVAYDGARDGTDNAWRDASRTGAQTQQLEEVRGLLRRETTKGRRKSSRASDESGAGPAESYRPTLPPIGVTAPNGAYGAPPVSPIRRPLREEESDEFMDYHNRQYPPGDTS